MNVQHNPINPSNNNKKNERGGKMNLSQKLNKTQNLFQKSRKMNLKNKISKYLSILLLLGLVVFRLISFFK